jgi:hypothetical protein
MSSECPWFQGSQGDFCGGSLLQSLHLGTNLLKGQIPEDIRLLSSLTLANQSECEPDL